MTRHPSRATARGGLAHAIALQLALLTGIGMLATTAVAQAAASSARQQHDIPAGELGTALTRYAGELAVTLSFTPEIVAGLRTQGLNGEFTVEEGFARLLAGSGLRVVAGSNGSYTLQKLPASGGQIVLSPLKVVGQRTFPYQEGITLDQSYIDDQIHGKGDLATLLRISPNVQFDDEASASSFQGGEIRPGDISINGGLYYQNLYQLDGVSFNNDLDPQNGSVTPHSQTEVPSHAQGIALDVDLIGRITVYDSNVPAAFGGFSGGVIDVESRKATSDLSGKVYYRMERSVWNEQILPSGYQDSYDLSAFYTQQPEYDKYKVGAVLEGRTAGGIGLIGNISSTWSDIPLRGYESGLVSVADAMVKEQRRRNTSASLRGDWQGENIELTASLTYAPTSERYFTMNTRDGFYDIEQGGTLGSIRMQFQRGNWNILQTLGVSDMQSSREVPDGIDYWIQWARSEEKNWGNNNFSQEGNYGNIEQVTRDISYKLMFEREPLQLRWGEHSLQLGLEYKHRYASYHRPNDHYVYTSAGTTDSCTDANGTLDTQTCSLSPVYTTSGGVVAGSGQYLRTLNLYSAGRFDVRNNELGVFVQDDIRIGNWSLRPGLRFDTDGMMEKDSIAPRLAVSWDVFGEQTTLLTGGINRYYGRNFFTYALKEGREWLRQSYSRTASTLLWTASSSYTSTNRFQELDIPYSDELNLGINQRWLGLDFNLKYVHREGRDEVMRERVSSNDDSGLYSNRVYQYVNNGRSKSETISLSISTIQPWQWRGSTTSAQLSLDHTDTRRNYSNYDSSYTDGSYNRFVRYEGEIIRAYDLPQDSYNRPWTARLSTQTRFDNLGLVWSNFLRYRAGYRDIISVGSEDYNGEEIDVMADYDYPNTWTWDTSVEYNLPLPLPRDQKLYVRVESQNVLNRSNLIRTGSSDSTTYYESGRSYWLELGYRF